jgi:hypothetical protein
MIEIEVLNTAQDYRRILFQQHWKRVALIGIVWLIIIVPTIWLTMFGAGANPFEAKSNDPLIVMSLFGILPILMTISLYFGVWRQAVKTAEITERTIFIFSDQGLKTETETYSSNMKWNRFSKVKETKTDFIFYPQENVFFVIPKRFYQNSIQIDTFKRLVSDKLGTKANLKK